MPELRLIDPNGYTVPGAVVTVPDDQEAATRAWLLAEVAPQDADHWAAYGHPYTARQYRVTPPVAAQETTNKFKISCRLHRPERHFGESRGVTIWTYTRIVGGRVYEFDVTHDAASRETTVRVYPGGGMVPPSHDFSVHGVPKAEIGRQVLQLPMPTALPAPAA